MNTLVEQEKVRFVYVQNPLQPAENRVEILADYDGMRTLADYLGPLEGEWAVSVSGRIIEQDQWALTYLHLKDCVVIAPMIYGGGGGGGKTVLRLVAIIALTVVSAGAGAAFGAAAGSALGISAAAGTALVSAGVMMAGTMAINALLPPATPKTPATGNDYDSSPTYGIDGPKNISTSGIPVPVIYGEAWFGGNFIQSYVDNVGDDQYLNLLVNLGEGPIDSVSDIYVNDQPISSYNNVQIWFRNGTANQEMIPYFDDIITAVNRSVELTSGNYMTHVVEEPVDRLRVDVVMPSGVSRADDEDGLVPFTANFTLEIREAGGVWRPFVEGAGSATVSIGGKQMSPLRRSYYSATLNKSKTYEIRAIHQQATDDSNTSNKITLTDINYILFDDMNYRHTALFGMRIKLSSQLSGIPSVIYRVKGRKVPLYNPVTGNYVETWTANPAWIALDVLMNKRYGGKIPLNRIKLDYFRQWATFCTNNNLTFNGTIDQRTNLWDALAPICKVGRAQIVRAGTRFQVSMVRKSKPVQMFSMGNVKKGSLSIDWLPQDERANEVRITYYDKNDQGKQKTVIVPNQAARERGEESNPTELTLYGVDNVEQATREGTLAMNMQQLLKTISFEAPISAIVCTLGDVIGLQHDVPNWGQGGLLEDGNTKRVIKVDKPVDMSLGGTYVARVRHDKVLQGTWEVETIVGNIVIPTGPFNVQMFERYRRLVNPGTGADYQIQEAIIDQFGRHGLRLDRVTGLTVGTTIQLYDTNVIESRVVGAVSADGMTISVTSDFSAIPRAGTPWAFGLNETEIMLMTVTGITGKDDMWRVLTGIEYTDDAYDDTVIDYKPDPINTNPVIPPVVFDGFKERRYLVGAAYTSDVEMTWRSNDTAYNYAEVHINIDNEGWRFKDANATFYNLAAINSGTIQVKLIPVTIEGFKPSWDSQPIYTYTVVGGVPRNPDPPLNFRVGTITNDIIELLWGDFDAWSAAQNVYAYEIWHAEGENAVLESAQLLAVTKNNHYPHVGLKSDTYYTYWVRAVNVLTNGKKSNFVPAAGLSVKTLPADTIYDLFPGGIGLTDLDDQLQSEVTKNEDISAIVSELAAKVEEVTDGNKMEIFQRKEAIAGVEAFVRQEVSTLVQEDQAIATMLTELEARVNDDIAAQLSEEKIARADADSAIAATVTQLQAKVNNDITAAIQSEAVARADQDSALAGQINTISARVGSNETAITQQAQVVDGLKAQYTVKINSNGHVVGFGLATTNSDGGSVASEFSIVADQFKVVKPGTTSVIPVFTVDAAKNRVVIQNAIVGDLQSDNYVAGVSGWCIKK